MIIDEALVYAVTALVLVVVTLCAITDILEHRIPNSVLLPALLLAFLFNTVLSGFSGLLDSFLGLVLGMAMLFPLYFSRGTSAGDVKLLGVVGALLGAKGALIAGIATLCFGGALGIVFVAWRLIEPLLAAQIAQIVSPDGPRERLSLQMTSGSGVWKAVFPYAPAVACGSYFALWHLGYFRLVTG